MMRRKDREITGFDHILKVMKCCKVCHVAFFDDEYPYVVPMTFGIEVNENNEVNIYFHGAKEGRKHDLIKKDNKVSFVMEDIHGIVTGPQVGACECTMEFECVMGTGTIEYVAEEEKFAALQTMLQQYDVQEGKDNYHFQHQVVPRIHVLRLRVNSLSAKKREVATQK
ncbi:pyridoxamine 5'-phosphate oxidase [Sporomusaceae bacterium FL31]|nr:pyridoxamine 5'-phosphate oxidase [Sporomusaceae bacterium FL31]GCE34483.1 pyridoxamine 5'-phosphate oxidase [Sporomusaceae bacterium]